MIRSVPAALLLVALGTAACGYRMGPGEPLGGAVSVALPVFDNRTWRRGVETDLARHLLTEVHTRTRLEVRETGADLVVRGSISRIEEDPLSQTTDEALRESSILVTAEVRVIDGRTGEERVPRKTITERESFVPGIGESLRTARAEALRRIASRVVDLLEAP